MEYTESLGVASNSVYPGSRHGGASWTDLTGNLWLLDGESHDVERTNWMGK